MDNENDSSANDAQAQLSCVQSIWRSTKGLIDLIGENAADIVADDMADEQDLFSIFKPLKNIRFHSWPVFITGVCVGALTVFGTFRYISSKTASDQSTENLMQERAAETQTLTPIANIALPLVSNVSTLPDQENAAAYADSFARMAEDTRRELGWEIPF